MAGVHRFARSPGPAAGSAGRLRTESGGALIVALMAMTLMLAFGSALVLIAVTETKISAYHANGVEALYAADAAIERALVDLAQLATWDAALNGTATSTFTDGGSGGIRIVSGTRIDLDEATRTLRCGRPGSCSSGDASAFTVDRPYGVNNPWWQLYAWGPLAQVDAGGQTSPYVAVWVGDDPAEQDGDPQRDGTEPDDPGRGVIRLTSQAFGAAGVRRAVEVTIVRRSDPDDTKPAAALRVVSWREVR
ncbi:MAG TPA: pilus assembly PilX N-terminal domain-containing protein [Vicinamibacterales bacterium]|nr:pilus assembly PilX N-terminal domain-containing protein [Vicinamibacterales bacterium]